MSVEVDDEEVAARSLALRLFEHLLQALLLFHEAPINIRRRLFLENFFQTMLDTIDAVAPPPAGAERVESSSESLAPPPTGRRVLLWGMIG